MEAMSDHFEVFDLPRRLQVDEAELQRRFYELSRRYHPDFHQAASPDEQARMLDASARLNAAYRTLRDPVARIEYLIGLEEGRQTKEGATGKPQAPPALLEEMFEIQEALAEARAAGVDPALHATLGEQRGRLVERRRQEEARLAGALSAAWDAAPDPAAGRRVLEECKERLATRAYLRTVIGDMDEVLSGEPGDVGVPGAGEPR
jgi:molecular chaperone HscB